MRDDEMMHYTDIGSEYLKHHGIKGQKHGVRRWQYKDGSLTPEGRIHYGYNSKESTGANPDEQSDIQNRSDRPTPWSRKSTGEKAAIVASTAYNVANDKALNDALKKLADNDRQKKKNKALAMNAAVMKNLSNEQLQAVIDRKNLERKFLTVTTPEVQSGYDKTMQILGTVGAVGATTLTVLQVANLVKQMRG